MSGRPSSQNWMAGYQLGVRISSAIFLRPELPPFPMRYAPRLGLRTPLVDFAARSPMAPSIYTLSKDFGRPVRCVAGHSHIDIPTGIGARVFLRHIPPANTAHPANPVSGGVGGGTAACRDPCFTPAAYLGATSPQAYTIVRTANHSARCARSPEAWGWDMPTRSKRLSICEGREPAQYGAIRASMGRF